MSPVRPTSTLTLTSVLAAAALDPHDVLLLRHSLKDPRVREAYESGDLRAYASEQDAKFPTHHRYWLNFVGEAGTSARLVACYENRSHAITSDHWPLHFNLGESSVLADLVGRLVIDWGPGTIQWWQGGASAGHKPVLAIREHLVESFPGFERLVLTFAALETLVQQPDRYAAWHASMSAVSAIYLIAHTTTGQLYVGSAQGSEGLLGRWKDYVNTRHGGDVKLVAEIQADPSAFESFQFSVLQILPKTTPPGEVLAWEALYKRKLLSIPFGLNAN